MHRSDGLLHLLWFGLVLCFHAAETLLVLVDGGGNTAETLFVLINSGGLALLSRWAVIVLLCFVTYFPIFGLLMLCLSSVATFIPLVHTFSLFD